MTALAVVETKISSVSLVVEADMEVGQNIQDQEIEVTPKSDKYSAGEYEFLNTGFSWSEEDIPVVKVSIYAEDGYKFAVSKDKITLQGATFVDTAVRMSLTRWLLPCSCRRWQSRHPPSSRPPGPPRREYPGASPQEPEAMR